MRTVVELLRLPRAAALVLLSAGVAACSADSTRFSGGNDNPYAARPGEVTGSVPAGQAAPAGRVESQPLPPAGQQYASHSAGRPTGGTAGTAGGGRGMASYSPGAAHGPAAAPVSSRPMPGADITGTVPAAPRPSPTSGHWSWDGGTPITVGAGDTIEGLARRYGVPASAIMQTNNLAGGATLRPGQPLVIPRYQGPAAAAAGAPHAAAGAAPRPAPAASAGGNPGIHIVAPGETLTRISRLYGRPLAEIARANNLAAGAHLKVGDRIVIPGVRASRAPQKPASAIAQAKPAPAPTEPAKESVSMFAPVPEAPAASDATKAAQPTGALPTFRWPARGRVITGHGPQPNGTQNDGINIALPEGTPVKAAEDGVVAYANNELKGYGNLVLVRHSNGYVTAYAHAKELLVKRGETVKRGQVIAKSGQSGNVTSPQLHFEVRKGATPLDPMRYLNGG
jgi:murein DD-endopeptidase MepM/ murein hydrolase activator NlpD